VATHSRESIDAKSRALTPAATVARVGGRGVLGIANLVRVITLHTLLAYLFFLTVLIHFGAALMHGVMRWELTEAAVTPSE
jgi:cytochrome b561